MDNPAAVSIKGLKKIYGNSFSALKGIDLEVKQGDFFALLGPNGAGKSTTIGILCNLVNKTSGSVKVLGYDLDKEPGKVKQMLGVVPQEFNFGVFERVIDIVINQAGYYGVPRKQAIERAEYYLKKLDLWEKREQQARMLSGGMKRRLMIARGLVHDPKILILDEPTAGVDIELRRSMWEFITELNETEGRTIILTTHYLEEAEELCRNIAIINEGKIVVNTSIKKLLATLDYHTIILNTAEEMQKAPELKGYEVSLKDETTLEVTFSKSDNLNQIFEELNGQGLTVTGMRNKRNRLEELFMRLVHSNNQEKEGGKQT